MLSLLSLFACITLPPADSAGADTAGAGPAVVDLGTSEHGTCAVTDDGALWCWGALAFDEGASIYELAGPVRVEGLDPVLEVELGRNLCVRYVDGSIGCFDPAGVHIDEDGVRVGAPGLVYPDAAAFDVGHVYVLRQTAAGEAALQAWYHGTLLDPYVLDADTAEATIGVSDHICRREADGAVICEGMPDPVPVAAASLLRTGVGQLCVLDDAGRPSCWIFAEARLATVPAVSGAIDLSVGRDQACALLPDGAVACWGPGAVDVSGLPPIVALSGDDAHTCGIDVDGGVWCWGDDRFAQLGAPDTGPGPVAVSGLP